jgi:hypothetical protein
VGVVILSQLGIHWLVRIAGYVVVGAIVAIVLGVYRDWEGMSRANFDFTSRLMVEFVAEALVIATWIEWGGIIGHGSKVYSGTVPQVSESAA